MSSQRALENAIRAGDVSTLAALTNIRDVIAQPIYGKFTNRTVTLTNPLPLQFAVLMEQPDVVRFLLENGANPNQSHSQSDSPPTLHIAVALDRSDLIQLLVAKGALVDAKNEAGLTPLHASLLSPNVDTMVTLLNLGAQPLGTDSKGVSVVQAAGMLGLWTHMSILRARCSGYPQMVCVDFAQWEMMKSQVTALEVALSRAIGEGNGGVCPICRMKFEQKEWVEHVRNGCPTVK